MDFTVYKIKLLLLFSRGAGHVIYGDILLFSREAGHVI